MVVDVNDLFALDSELDETEQLVRDTVRRFVEEKFLPIVEDHFEAGSFPEHLVPTMGELGLLGMHLEGYGCAGLSATAYGVACRELERGDSGLRSFVAVQGSLCMSCIRRYASEEQKKEWLPRMAVGEVIGCFGLTEPDFGSNPSGMQTRAEWDGASRSWVLNGAKRWITNAGIAHVAIVWARTDDGIRGFLVPTDTSGFETRPIERKLSLRVSVTGEFYLDDCRIPEENMLPLAEGLGAALSCLNEARFGIAWGAVGAALACFATARDYALERPVFGKLLGAHQLTQAKLADMLTAIASAQLQAQRLARLKERGELQPVQVSMAKRHNVRAALEVARTARALLGANGISLEYPVMRHMVNLESVLTYEGTEEIHALVLGEAVTGIPAYS